jgi:hypothetical protein
VLLDDPGVVRGVGRRRCADLDPQDRLLAAERLEKVRPPQFLGDRDGVWMASKRCPWAGL